MTTRCETQLEQTDPWPRPKMKQGHEVREIVTCWGCLNQWCDRCDPAPSALCHYCHGSGIVDYPIERVNV